MDKDKNNAKKDMYYSYKSMDDANLRRRYNIVQPGLAADNKVKDARHNKPDLAGVQPNTSKTQINGLTSRNASELPCTTSTSEGGIPSSHSLRIVNTSKEGLPHASMPTNMPQPNQMSHMTNITNRGGAIPMNQNMGMRSANNSQMMQSSHRNQVVHNVNSNPMNQCYRNNDMTHNTSSNQIIQKSSNNQMLHMQGAGPAAMYSSETTCVHATTKGPTHNTEMTQIQGTTRSFMHNANAQMMHGNSCTQRDVVSGHVMQQHIGSNDGIPATPMVPVASTSKNTELAQVDGNNSHYQHSEGVEGMHKVVHKSQENKPSVTTITITTKAGDVNNMTQKPPHTKPKSEWDYEDYKAMKMVPPWFISVAKKPKRRPPSVDRNQYKMGKKNNSRLQGRNGLKRLTRNYSSGKLRGPRVRDVSKSRGGGYKTKNNKYGTKQKRSNIKLLAKNSSTTSARRFNVGKAPKYDKYKSKKYKSMKDQHRSPKLKNSRVSIMKSRSKSYNTARRQVVDKRKSTSKFTSQKKQTTSRSRNLMTKNSKHNAKKSTTRDKYAKAKNSKRNVSVNRTKSGRGLDVKKRSGKIVKNQRGGSRAGGRKMMIQSYTRRKPSASRGPLDKNRRCIGKNSKYSRNQKYHKKARKSDSGDNLLSSLSDSLESLKSNRSKVKKRVSKRSRKRRRH